MPNILETTLAMLGIEKYSKHFRAYGVDTTVLSLLSDNDLKIIGIEDVELRKRILKQFSTLPAPDEYEFYFILNFIENNMISLLVTTQI